MESKKNDILDNKLRWDLLPLEEIEDIVKVYTVGADKYGPNKWQGLEDGYNRYKGALLRHLVEYEKGNEYDDETKCRHLAQVAWNAIAMLYTSKHKTTEGSGFKLGDIGTEKKEVINDLISNLDKKIIQKIDVCNDLLNQMTITYDAEPEKESDGTENLIEFGANMRGKDVERINDINERDRLFQDIILRSDKITVAKKSCMKFNISYSKKSTSIGECKFNLLITKFAYIDAAYPEKTLIKEISYDMLRYLITILEYDEYANIYTMDVTKDSQFIVNIDKIRIIPTLVIRTFIKDLPKTISVPYTMVGYMYDEEFLDKGIERFKKIPEEYGMLNLENNINQNKKNADNESVKI